VTESEIVAETRIDHQTGDWRIIAPDRAGRPGERRGADAPCPFCPGNEAMTPPEVLRVPAGTPSWRIRIVPNLYGVVTAATGDGGRPAATGDGDRPAAGDAFPSTGWHEVVVESHRHDWDARYATPDEMTEILSTMRQRCRMLADQGPAAVIVFRNHGRGAGRSMSHPHSQIVALDQPPPGLVERWRRARAHHEATGRRLHDDLAVAERDTGTRVVADTDGVLVFQPFTASVPYETTLLPPPGSADLAGASDDALAALARTLPRLLTALATVLDDPAYNLVVHAGPAGDADAHRWFRWHLSLYPRITTPGGLELATGLAVNPSAPEATAPILRRALAAVPVPG
jgi:UDPglucose--hexose-1-phosphate uridylyltransferase